MTMFANYVSVFLLFWRWVVVVLSMTFLFLHNTYSLKTTVNKEQREYEAVLQSFDSSLLLGESKLCGCFFLVPN